MGPTGLIDEFSGWCHVSEGCIFQLPVFRHRHGRNLFEVAIHWTDQPQVGHRASGQPGALGRNPVGIVTRSTGILPVVGSAIARSNKHQIALQLHL